MNAKCPLCRLCEKDGLPRKDQKIHYEDEICIIVDCLTHPTKKLIILKRHTLNPTEKELNHLNWVADNLYLGRKWRDSSIGSIPDHFHLHAL